MPERAAEAMQAPEDTREELIARAAGLWASANDEPSSRDSVAEVGLDMMASFAIGPDHRDTLTARSNLAAAYQVARRLNEAIPAYERAVTDSERMLGAGDMETITTRCNLATALYEAGRMNDMVRVLRRALADCEQFLGPGHEMTVMVAENLESVTK